MNSAPFIERYDSLSAELVKILSEAEQRIIGDPADEYFVKNANFLTKSFLISLCCYLEAFLKEIANSYVDSIKVRAASAKIPHNLVSWSLSKDGKIKDMQFSSFNLAVTSKEIDDELSGNPFRTYNCFQMLGVDLNSAPNFSEKKDIVNSVVAKRNNIIHHNDTATNISLGDIRTYSEHFKIYVRAIAEAVEKSF
jgi:hypothetical protein